jgi:hyperosmotically inducible protein
MLGDDVYCEEGPVMRCKRRLIWLVWLVLPLSMSGCAPVLIGGAAVGGYYVGKDDRSVSQIASDASITASINAKYAKDSQVSAIDINVDTRYGVVVLYGNVSSQHVANRAVQIARSTKGVKKVISKLTVIAH